MGIEVFVDIDGSTFTVDERPYEVKGHSVKYGDRVRVRKPDGSCVDVTYKGKSTKWSPTCKVHLIKFDVSMYPERVGHQITNNVRLRFVYPVEKMELYRAKTNN